MTDYRIEHGLAEEFSSAAADLYEDAFGQKTKLIIPDGNRRRAILLELMDRASCISVVAGGSLLGIAGYQTRDSSFSGGLLGRGLDVRTAVGLLPLLPALRAWLMSQLFKRRPHAGDLVLDGIAVASAARGKGIGATMLDELVRLAGAEGYASVSLKVIDTNPGAYALYLRKGFEPVNVERFEFLRGVLGFGSTTTMRAPTRLAASGSAPRH